MQNSNKTIYDVGMHIGEDTEYYLKKGYHVVAFEANPKMVELCSLRFSNEIKSGQLRIIAGAIAPKNSGDKIKFYINDKISVWGTIDNAWVRRNTTLGATSTQIEVDRVDIIAVISEFGMPFYLKIDIEGADGIVLSALREFSSKPHFVSIEANTVEFTNLIEDIDNLSALGYEMFQIVPQKNIGGSVAQTLDLNGAVVTHAFADGASGVFGEDLAGVWIDRDAVLASFLPPCDSWQDIHASLTRKKGRNLALNRPATQSSTSHWSQHPSPDIDAKTANNGDVTSPNFFHTEFETSPWWQVDLEGLYIIEKIVVYNRLDYVERLQQFSIIGSADGNLWTEIYSKSDDEVFNLFARNISGQKPVRFVRIRLDRPGVLHFREFQVFGRPAEARDA